MARGAETVKCALPVPCPCELEGEKTNINVRDVGETVFYVQEHCK